jgi:3-oxoacyl-(acyl-carrier-protein) synthase
MKRAFADMRLPTDEIMDVNGHATSPRAGDVGETNAVTQVIRHRCCDMSIDPL